jgi:hypothetical protein
MSDQQKPALEHEREVYGYTLRHSHDNDYAVLVDFEGKEQEFSENLGMIAQGAPSATLLAITKAKQTQAEHEKAKVDARKTEKAIVVDSPLPTDEPLESEGDE